MRLTKTEVDQIGVVPVADVIRSGLWKKYTMLMIGNGFMTAVNPTWDETAMSRELLGKITHGSDESFLYYILWKLCYG